MVEIDKRILLRGLINPYKIKKNSHKHFLKLSKKYPYFVAPHVINILISKNNNTVNYGRSLKAFSLNFIDREYIYNILNNQKQFDIAYKTIGMRTRLQIMIIYWKNIM